MGKVSFWYEIDEKAGLAYDKVSGEDAKAHTHVEIEFGRPLTEEEYTILHEQEVIDLFSTQTGIAKHHIKPISHELYLEEIKETSGTHWVRSTLDLKNNQ